MKTTVQQQLREALNEARKARDRARVVVFSSTLSDIRNREIELGQPADDEAAREVISRGIRKRREAAEQMLAGGRPELADREEAEITFLSPFLPPPMGEEEVRGLVRGLVAQGTSGVGPLMGRLAPLIRGRFDGREANRIVREELAG